jgi:hypothetical protein
MFTALSRELGSAGGPGTAASLARIRATLRTALNVALRQGLISFLQVSGVPLCRAVSVVSVTCAATEHRWSTAVGSRSSIDGRDGGVVEPSKQRTLVRCPLKDRSCVVPTYCSTGGSARAVGPW